MTSVVGFGEYDAVVPFDGVSLSRELFSREYVVQSANQDCLQSAVTSERWRGLARVHTGHVVVQINGVSVRGLSWREFNALWQQGAPASTGGVRCVRFRDRKRAECEVEMQKDWTGSAAEFSLVQDERELQTKLRHVHTLIWSHQLTEAYAVLHALPVGSDPMACLLGVELEVVRVLVSNDALYSKQALRAASQAVNWLQTLYELPSLSYSSRKRMKLALAEALFLLSLLRLGADQRLAAIATARRCSSLYVELRDKFLISSRASSKIKRLLMVESEVQDFLNRIKFGMAVLHVSGSLALQGSLEWVAVLMNGACDPSRGLQYLLDCSSVADDGASHFRSNWAALALMHSSAVLRRMSQQDSKSTASIPQSIANNQTAALQRHPNSLLFHWSRATASSFKDDRLSELEVALSRASSCHERVHLVGFDVGYRYFLSRDFDRSSVHLMPICKAASAPPRLRGLSSLFLAVGYLVSCTGDVTRDAKLVNSVRLLLRSSRRFLSLRLECNGDDAEAASLYERLKVFIDGSDEYLCYLPWEILYVFCYSTKVSRTMTSRTDAADRRHHLDALDRLKGLSNGKKDHVELHLLRAIVSFNLHELDSCEQELQEVWEALQAPGRCRSNSALSRLLSQRPDSSPPGFVAPVAWFYQLRVLLERKCSKSTVLSSENDPVASPRSSTSNTAEFGGSVQPSYYVYHYIYNGKLLSLTKLVARCADDKLNVVMYN